MEAQRSAHGCGVMISALRSPLRRHQYGDPRHRREQRPLEHAEPDLRRVGAVIPGEGADEEAHGEADAGQEGDTGDAAPGDPRGTLAEAELDGEPGGAEDADLLAQEEPDCDPARYAMKQIMEADPGEIEAGIGEAEERHHQEGTPGMHAMLDMLQR